MKRFFGFSLTLFLALSGVFLLFLHGPCGARGESVLSRRAIPLYTYRIMNVYSRDPDAFTQGLIYYKGFLYEGTGRYGRSSLRKLDLKSGRVLKARNLPGKYFGEGITICGERLFQLTWKSRKGFIYDVETLRRIGKFSYRTEGWGITCDGRYLIMSDGTSTLQFLDPRTFNVVKRLAVKDGETSVPNLNELEFVKGEIFANLLDRPFIAMISPETGQVTGWIDLSGLYYNELGQRPSADVLNGIAYDPDQDRLFVTGKLWSKLFEIRIIQKK